MLLASKVEGTQSARVTISLEHKDKALMPEFVRVRSWVMKPRWASETVSRNIAQDGRSQN